MAARPRISWPGGPGAGETSVGVSPGHAHIRHVHCGWGPADEASLAPGMAPEACLGVRITSLNWSSVTESNRRPSPYYVQLSGPRDPGSAPDQEIRWHTPAQASLDQRRRAPFAPQSAPQARRSLGPATPVTRRSAAHSSALAKLRAEVREHRARRSARHVVNPFTWWPTRRPRLAGIAPADRSMAASDGLIPGVAALTSATGAVRW